MSPYPINAKPASQWGKAQLCVVLQLRYGGLPAVVLHPHWRMDLFMPEVEG